MKKGLTALALGTFSLGMAEYVMMSILPDLASAFGVSIAEAGHLISLYALGVCAGAPLSAIFLRNRPLRHTLLLLMAVYIVGNLMFAVSHSFGLALVARFVSGLPHGAYFGTGAIVASRLQPGKATTAVAMMVMGMTVANFIGVPLGSFIANTGGWRWIFLLNIFWGALSLVSIALFVKGVGRLKPSDIKGMFRFMKRPEPWLLILATMMCNGGAFAMYSYVAPVMELGGFNDANMPALMLAVGASMCFGNYEGGRLGDRYSPSRVAGWVTLFMAASLIAVAVLAGNYIASGAAVLLVTAALFAISSPMQLLLIEYSPGGELMGGAMVQVAFNLGNALGAMAGGIPLDAGMSARWTAIVGCGMAAVSAVVMIIFRRRISNKSSNKSFICF